MTSKGFFADQRKIGTPSGTISYVYFDLKWSHWLEKTIPGTKKRVEFKSARIFFPEERWSELNAELRTPHLPCKACR